MKKNAFIIFLIILSFSFACVSCDNVAVEWEKEENGEVELVISSLEEKGLKINTPSTVKTFEYKATPYFEESEEYIALNGGIVGSTNGKWRSVIFQDANGEDATVGHLRASMGYYHAGRWEIEIRAKNANGNILFYGTTGKIYINKARKNAFIIALRGVKNAGGTTASLSATFTGLETTDGDGMIPYLRLTYLDGTILEWKGTTDGWEKNKVGNGRIKYNLEKQNLPSGEVDVYIALLLKNDSVNTAEAFKTILIEGEKTEITGTIESGAYISPSFDIKQDVSEIEGKIVSISGVKEKKDNQSGKRYFEAEPDKDVSFKYEVENSSDYTVSWYIDSVFQSQGKIFNFSSGILGYSGGNYTLTAVIERGEKTKSEEIKLVLIPEEL